MPKIYKNGTKPRLLMTAISILAVGGFYILFSEALNEESVFRLVLSIYGIGCLVFSVLLVFSIKYTITDEGIQVEAGKILNLRKLAWFEIDRVVYDLVMPGMRVYHIIPRDPLKKIIHINSLIGNSSDLLAEVIERVPHAIIDSEIRIIVAEYKASQPK